MQFSTPEFYVNALLGPAKEIGNKHNIPYVFILAQGALESDWGCKAIGNNIFGIKAGKGWTGKKQLIVTTEYLSNKTTVFPEIISISQCPNGKYKYIVKDYFRDYDSLSECLEDHCQFLITNKRYAAAFNYTDPENFALEVAKARYATAENYGNTLIQMIHSVEKRLPK